VYSNKEHVNILTALFVRHGVRHAVVCPGSRNAPIVHNLNECPDIKCHAVTDERSAGFYALGMTQALNEPVAVCVTSGTALLNLLPAVAEAWYQHLPLVVISADRPQQWIDQLDGQTLPQPGALGRFTRCNVSLPEISPFTHQPSPTTQEQRWHCNRLVNEALIAATKGGDPRPVHINVPISEPLFTFDIPELPEERSIVRITPPVDYDVLPIEFVDGLAAAKRPMIVFGQVNPHDFDCDGVDYLFGHVIVLHETLATFPHVSHFDEVLFSEETRSKEDGDDQGLLPPDFIVYVGDCIVSKRLRQFLRRAIDAETWRISYSGDVEDTFMNLRGIIVGDAEQVLQALDDKMRFRRMAGREYRRQWLRLLTQAGEHARNHEPGYSQMAAVREFERQLTVHYAPFTPHLSVHYANSSSVRLANIYAEHHVWCNRGVNGIEGSLSTAAGYSIVADSLPYTLHPSLVFCVIGDLSFFYDQNALWNQELGGSLRVLLLNNGCGGIFRQLPGLEQSPARDRYVTARHSTTAEGICMQHAVGYRVAHDMETLRKGVEWLMTAEATKPLLLEVKTDADSDDRELRNYYRATKF
jgi:2-succinyl-5-enolpyruvyl-6-hydroxy-3-cyclohexene-1-carboxylate synthase